jgi:hypothetical protein
MLSDLHHRERSSTPIPHAPIPAIVVSLSTLCLDFVVKGDDDKKGENYTLAFSFLGNVTVASW